MTLLYVVVGVVIIAMVAFVSVFGVGGVDEKAKYQYKKKEFFLSRAEHGCYDALVNAVGQEYRIFAQVHLPTLLEHKIKGQNWRGAFRHIDEKSVDFVLCDKEYLSPKLAIELDDRSHERPNRKLRDQEVKRIFQEAGLPLLRLENHGSFDPGELAQKIKDKIA